MLCFFLLQFFCYFFSNCKQYISILFQEDTNTTINSTTTNAAVQMSKKKKKLLFNKIKRKAREVARLRQFKHEMSLVRVDQDSLEMRKQHIEEQRKAQRRQKQKREEWKNGKQTNEQMNYCVAGKSEVRIFFLLFQLLSFLLLLQLFYLCFSLPAVLLFFSFTIKCAISLSPHLFVSFLFHQTLCLNLTHICAQSKYLKKKL